MLDRDSWIDSEQTTDCFSLPNACHGLADPRAADQTGAAIAGLANYSVNVSVVPESYGPGGAPVNGLRIDVTVTDPAGESLTLTGYRANY